MKVKLGNKSVTVNKWKGKNKKKFLSEISTGKPDTVKVMDALVYDCIEEDVILSNDEARFVLTKIRIASLGDDLRLDLACEKCLEEYSLKYKISEYIKSSGGKLDSINIPGTKTSPKIDIEFGEIQNKEAYINTVTDNPELDIFFRISKFNGEEALSLDELIEKFDDIDLDLLDKTMKKFNEKKFKVNDVNNVTCPKCEHVQEYEFDDMPGFFPEEWFTGVFDDLIKQDNVQKLIEEYKQTGLNPETDEQD